MRAYIGFDRNIGPEEGAILIFANTVREARKISFGFLTDGADAWVDYAVRWIKREEIFKQGDQEKIKDNEPHVVYDPVGCDSCEMWNCGITENNLCCNCMQYPGDRLIELLTEK